MKTTRHNVRLVAALAAFSALSTIGYSEKFARDSNFEPIGHSMDPKLIEFGFPNNDAALQPVKLKFTVTEKGIPTNVEVVAGSGNGDVDRRCVSAVKQQRFEPKFTDGVAVSRDETMVMIPKMRL